MTANAPYYQTRAGQFIATPSGTNAAPPQFVPEDDEYDLAASAAVASPLDRHLTPSLYSEHFARHQTPADHTLEENHNLAELLEAATAAGQAATAMNIDDAGAASTAPQGRSKRKKVSSSPADDATYQAEESVNAKRRRVGGFTDPQLPDGDPDLRGTSADDIVPPSSESLLKDARAAGVHSAAALFRRSSERTSRKYTRPPMSKLFMSLQLSPENFLQLQASAKAYMLDLSYPERQNCVGNRGKGDTDMVKLRLFNCVRDFLNDRVGEQFFGEHVEKPGENEAIEAARALGEEKRPDTGERLTWPRDGNKIISLVTPLMRRMVTNERQRQYAIETRKGGAKKKDKEGSVEATTQQINRNSGYEVEQQLQSALDPGLGEHLQPSATSTPIAATPAQSIQTEYRHEPHRHQETLQEDAKSSDQSNMALPTTGPVEPNLSDINIFLVLPTSGTRPTIKLDEKRITAQPHTHLAWYDWSDFMTEVINLLEKAKARYPAIRNKLVLKGCRNGADNLRGLAAAANALQTDDPQHELSTSGEPSIADPSSSKNTLPLFPTADSAGNSNSVFNTDNDPEARLLPRYVIKTTGSDSRRDIRSADDWYSVLREKAFSVWADGVCNVLVELVDISLDAPRAM
ncbi:hypothetical protein EJ02DRAFT_18494 [Clathrospora elynae]|uniref:Uncharacterized protein n=1 Tax=Clathrospora elynae TaxID=706981 RepID=A0A6A5SF19_9PLEO|nr:hypothetical protein EJ02DRAFT_18494 [Clathrospora elynae]